MLIRQHHSLQQLLDNALKRRCPHCDVFAHMALQSTPSWQSLMDQRPSRLGVVAVCPSCALPVFFTSEPLQYAEDHIAMHGELHPVITPRQRIDLHHLPATLRDLVDEVLGCYADGHWQAVALLAHRIATAAARDLGGNGKLTIFNAVADAADMASIEKPLLRLCQHILFDLEADHEVPALSRTQATVLMALLRDFLDQIYVRSGNLKRAARATR